jgi:hypothetical protein
MFLSYGSSRKGKFARTTSQPALSGGKRFTTSYLGAAKRVEAVAQKAPRRGRKHK